VALERALKGRDLLNIASWSENCLPYLYLTQKSTVTPKTTFLFLTTYFCHEKVVILKNIIIYNAVFRTFKIGFT